MRGRLLRLRRRLARARALWTLRRDPDPAVAAVGRALTAAVRGADGPEREWVGRIEALRTDLANAGGVIRAPRSTWTGDPADAERIREASVTRLALEVSKPERWGRVLLQLSRELAPARSLELGTCIGLSTAYQAAGLELAGGDGRLTTLEGDPGRSRLALESLARLGLADRVEARPGRFDDTLEPVLAEVERLDFAFVDGDHKLQSTLDYFERIGARMNGAGVLLFDDIRWSDGMREAWSRISTDPRVAVAVDLHGLGLCVLGDGADGPARSLSFRLHL